MTKSTHDIVFRPLENVSKTILPWCPYVTLNGKRYHPRQHNVGQGANHIEPGDKLELNVEVNREADTDNTWFILEDGSRIEVACE